MNMLLPLKMLDSSDSLKDEELYPKDDQSEGGSKPTAGDISTTPFIFILSNINMKTKLWWTWILGLFYMLW